MSFHIPPGSMILTPAEARLLYGPAQIKKLRERFRPTTPLGQLLVDISVTAFHEPAENGNHTRQETASEKTEYTTVRQVARRTGLSERAVRLDAQHQILPADKQGREWIILTADADAYIAARRKN